MFRFVTYPDIASAIFVALVGGGAAALQEVGHGLVSLPQDLRQVRRQGVILSQTTRHIRRLSRNSIGRRERFLYRQFGSMSRLNSLNLWATKINAVQY